MKVFLRMNFSFNKSSRNNLYFTKLPRKRCLFIKIRQKLGSLIEFVICNLYSYPLQISMSVTFCYNNIKYVMNKITDYKYKFIENLVKSHLFLKITLKRGSNV